MTRVGSGGVVVARWRKSKRFHRDYDDLSLDMKDLVDQKLQDLARDPRPPGLRFEKLKGYSDPDIYTIHITGNYKVSLELVDGNCAFLRRVGNHDEVDRAP
jgi:mRNA-degrading endonuclease RelE of RelBE toxin-antitoxin system